MLDCYWVNAKLLIQSMILFFICVTRSRWHPCTSSAYIIDAHTSRLLIFAQFNIYHNLMNSLFPVHVTNFRILRSKCLRLTRCKNKPFPVLYSILFVYNGNQCRVRYVQCLKIFPLNPLKIVQPQFVSTRALSIHILPS